MNTNEIVCASGNAFTYVMAAIQQNEILQIIEFVFSAVLTSVILAYRIWRWFKEAKKDGKIDDKEVSELGEILEEAKKDLDNKKGDDHE